MEKEVTTPVKARVIIELLGSPKEHIESTLKTYIDKLKKDNTLKVLKEERAEATETKNGLYSTFAELEISFKDANHLVAFCFDAMPSSVEILEPEELILNAKDFEGLVNDLQARLHTVDLAIKKLKATTLNIDANAVNIFRNFVIYALKEGEKTIDELAKMIGTNQEHIKPFIEKLASENKIKKEGEKISLA